MKVFNAADLNEDYLNTMMGMAASGNCFLCGGNHCLFVGVFNPDKPNEFGAPIGKNRFFFYGLCEKCHEKKNCVDLVEAKIAFNLPDGKSALIDSLPVGSA